MSDDGERRSFLDTGLDLSRDDLSAEEAAALTAWYRENHGGDELSKFTTYYIAHDPEGFKRYRRHIQEIDAAAGARRYRRPLTSWPSPTPTPAWPMRRGPSTR